MKNFLRGMAVVLALGAGWVVYFHPLWVQDQRIRWHMRQAHVRSGYVELPMGRMHYFEATAAVGSKNIPLVLVHGLGSRGEDWSPMIPGLAAKGFHVFAPDLLGYGRSDKPDIDYSIRTEEAAMVQFMDAMHLTQADVAGWSMGGWIAMRLTLDHPERVNRLVVYDSVGIYFPNFNIDLFMPTDEDGLYQLMTLLEPKPPARLPHFAARAALRKMARDKWVIERSLVTMMSGRDLLDFRMGQLRQPMLIVWGGDDRLIPISVGQTLHRMVQRSVLAVAPGCGHLAPAECAGPIVEETSGFLSANPPISGGEVTLDTEKKR